MAVGISRLTNGTDIAPSSCSRHQWSFNLVPFDASVSFLGRRILRFTIKARAITPMKDTASISRPNATSNGEVRIAVVGVQRSARLRFHTENLVCRHIPPWLFGRISSHRSTEDNATQETKLWIRCSHWCSHGTRLAGKSNSMCDPQPRLLFFGSTHLALNNPISILHYESVLRGRSER